MHHSKDLRSTDLESRWLMVAVWGLTAGGATEACHGRIGSVAPLAAERCGRCALIDFVVL